MNIDELLEVHKEFAETHIKEHRKFTSQVVISIGGEVTPIVVTGGSENIKSETETELAQVLKRKTV